MDRSRFPGHPDASAASETRAHPVHATRRDDTTRRPGNLARLAIAGVVLVALLAVGLGLAQVGDGLTASSVAQGSLRSAPSSSPEDAPGPARNTSAIYDVAWAANSAGCPDAPRRPPPVPNAELRDHLQGIVDCLVSAHRPAVEATGIALTVPRVATFSTDVRSPCGVVSARDFPAFYCSADETIYVRYDADDDPDGFGRYPMGYWIIVSHEFGHHLQQRAGIFDEYANLRNRAQGGDLAELSRRLELQANCFSGAFLGATDDSIGYRAHHDDTVDFYRSLPTTGSATHGDRHTAAHWFTIGHQSRAFADCRTWEAPAEQVS